MHNKNLIKHQLENVKFQANSARREVMKLQVEQFVNEVEVVKYIFKLPQRRCHKILKTSLKQKLFKPPAISKEIKSCTPTQQRKLV